jgi:hypothetical protein
MFLFSAIALFWELSLLKSPVHKGLLVPEIPIWELGFEADI